MPKIRGYTPEQKRAQEAERVMLFIRRKSRESALRGLRGLAEAIGVNYNTLYSALRSGSIRASTMRDIIRALNMSNEDILFLMGRKS